MKFPWSILSLSIICGHIRAFEIFCPVIRIPDQFYLQEDAAVNIYNTWNRRISPFPKLYGKLYHCETTSCAACIECFELSSDCETYGSSLTESFDVNETRLTNNNLASISVRASFQAVLGELFLG